MNGKKNIIVIAVLVVLIAGLLYVTLSKHRTPDKGFTVGSVLILSGDFSSYGEQFRDGATLALAKIKEDKSMPRLNLMFLDSRGEKARARELVETLQDRDGVHYLADVMGSGVALDVLPLINERKMLVVSGVNTAPDLSGNGSDYFFRIIPSDGVASQQLVLWAKDQRLSRAVIVHDVDDWANGLLGPLRKEFVSSGGVIVADVDCARGFQLFGPLVSKVASERPDAVFLLLYPREAGLFIREAKRQGLQAIMMGTDNFTGAELLEHAGEAAEGVRFVVPGKKTTTAEYQDLLNRYKKVLGRKGEPELFTVMAYDVVSIVADLVRRFGNDTTAAAHYLERATYQGASGDIRFDRNGDIVVRDYQRMVFRKLPGGGLAPTPVGNQ